MIGIYTRVSKQKPKEETSIEIQTKKGIEFADSIGEDYIIFNEGTGKSGRKGTDRRPQFAYLIDAIRKKKVTTIYVLDQSRLERSNRLWQLFAHAIITSEAKYYPGGKFSDLTDALTKFQTNVISASNEFFADLTSEKVTETFQLRAERGLTHGIIPYGYYKDADGRYAVHLKQKEVIERIYKMSLSGVGTYTIANELNKDIIPTKYNSFDGAITRKDEYTGAETLHDKKLIKWRGNVILDMIKNPIYKGYRKWNNELFEIGVNIIDEDKWQKVNDNLIKNKKKKVGKNEEYHYLLNGLIYCSECDNEYRGKKKLKGRDSAYSCKGKKSKTCKNSRGLSIAKLESFVLKVLFKNKNLKDYLNGIKVNSKEVDLLQEKLDKTKKKLITAENRNDRAYELLFGNNGIDDERIRTDYSKSKKSIKHLSEDIEILQHQIAERNSGNRITKLNKIIEGFDYNHDFDTIKEAVHKLVKRIDKGTYTSDTTMRHIIQIHFKGFDESVMFSTNRMCNEWLWVNHYKSANALSEEELEEQRLEEIEILKFLKWDKKLDMTKYDKDNYKGEEVSTKPYIKLSLDKSELINFD